MKKLCLILCFVFMISLLAACSSNNNNTDDISDQTTTTNEPNQDGNNPQGITLDNTDGLIIGVDEIKKLTAISLSTNNVTYNVIWSSNDPSVATVDGSGNVRGVGNGTTVITATTIDGKNYQASCPVSVSSTVSKIELDQTSVTMNKGESITLTATILPTTVQNNGVIWYSSVESVATVTNNGMVSAVSSGATTICAMTPDGKFQAYCNVTVRTPVSSIDITDTAVTIEKGSTLTLSYTITPIDASDKTITWSSSDETVVTVYNGRITAVGAGSANITATASSGAKSTCLVTVTAKATGVTIENSEYTLVIDSSDMLLATVFPADANNKNVIWSSENGNIAEVESTTGIVTAVSCGETTVTVMTEDGSYTATCTVKVVNPIKTIKFDISQIELIKNNTVQLIPTITAENNLKPYYPNGLVWTSSDESIAYVSTNGLVTATGHGSAIITVTAENGVSASCTINSTDPNMLYVPVTDITTDKQIYTVYVGDKIQINTTIIPSNATDKSLTYEVSSDSFLSFTDGTIRAEKEGSVMLTIKTSNESVYAEVVIFIQTLTDEEVALRKQAYENALSEENARHTNALAQLKSAYDLQYASYERMLQAASDPKTQDKINNWMTALTAQYNTDCGNENLLHEANVAAIESEYEYLKDYIIDPPVTVADPTEEPDETGEPAATETGAPKTTVEP